MNSLKHLRSEFYKRKIIRLLTTEIATSLLLASIFCSIIGWSVQTFSISLLAFIIGGLGVITLFGMHRKPMMDEVVRFLDRTYPFMEDSTSLLVEEPKNDLEAWQKKKLETKLKEHTKTIELPNKGFKNSDYYTVAAFALSLLILFIQPQIPLELTSYQADSANVFTKEREIEQTLIPTLKETSILVNAPGYTRINEQIFGFESISVPSNSKIQWRITTGEETDSVHLVFAEGNRMALHRNENFYEGEIEVVESRIYQIAISNSDTVIFSEYISFTVISDQAPGFIVKAPAVIRSYISQTKKSFTVEIEVGDDYGITELTLEATLARGSGENVRFRERTLAFDEVQGMGTKKIEAKTILHSDSLEMEPGDELYFYASATDNRPSPQISRSDTYFIIYSDTSKVNQIEFSGLAIDLVPEYFRSQRQLIIDTEKLLSEQASLSKEEFGRRSEIIGYDQNLLRKRYGDYLGQEDEGFSMGGPADSGEEAEDHDHDHGQEEGHDDHVEDENLNGMGLENQLSDAASNIDSEFFHDHGSPEMNTLFAASPRQMLKDALDNMWNSELYLRTKDPETSLPYQYQALELLKKVQQANRQYTRKAGYKLPPIPESEKRLSGEYDDFANPESAIERERMVEPIAQLQALFRKASIFDNESLQKATQLVQQSEMEESDRLYILNRIRGLKEDRDNEIRQLVLARLYEIDVRILNDLAPESRPLLKKVMEN